MNSTSNIFSTLGFNFKDDLKRKTIEFESNSLLTDKLKNSVYYYKNPNNTNTSFYLIDTDLSNVEIEEIRKYTWNKNDADLLFYFIKDDDQLVMSYAKSSPKINNEGSILDRFSISEKDTEKIEQIKRWQFDSGVFWTNYLKSIANAKRKGIDKELVSTLEALKNQLYSILSNLISEEKKCNEIVQALIDRTLYIKYLEDNHIINSHFYKHYFEDENLNYEQLLENKTEDDINLLFKKIHGIFNNNLFDQPNINNEYLTREVRSLIATSFKADLKTGQLRLFDFRFDILPVEFISYIYEVFLSAKQKANGIYYTPKKLAQLIVDDVIKEDIIAPILDPSCGSGMFLIVGYQRLLEIAKKKNLEPEYSIEKIKFRTELLSKNIFGIEKELTAQRFTFFSLSLQIFEGINHKDIKEFISKELKEKDKVDLFSEYSFFNNIKHANSLSISEKPFENKSFSYVIGNPPFFEIPNTEEFKEEISFLNTFKINIPKEEKTITAKELVGKSQISQCFFLKIKEWSNENTRFGFVSNSSNFYNDYSNDFQEYFYSNYGLEKIYELSRVKKILFEKANEGVLALIFSNNLINKITEYYPVELGMYSEKPFELLIVKEDKKIEIEQRKFIDKECRLRDYLVGNQYDINMLIKFDKYRKLITYVLQDEKGKPYVHEGLKIVGEKAICKHYNLKRDEWEKLNRQGQLDYFEKFKAINTSPLKNQDFTFRLIKPINLNHFRDSGTNMFLRENISNFERPRNPSIFEGKKIIFNRTGNRLKSIYSKEKLYFDFDLHTLKLENEILYDLINAILNSKLSNYYIDVFLRKRFLGSYPKIGNEDILNIPFPKDLDQDLVSKISEISKDLTDGKFEYSEKENELNELIYELYELSYWEKQRVKDYFLPKERIGKKINKLKNYKTTIADVLNFYLKNPIEIEETSTDFKLIVIKITFNNNSNTASADKAKKFTLNEIFENNPNNNFLASQEKIYGRDCIYILKEDYNTNWTETKAFEDGQDILKHLIPKE